jgi:CDP-Glycerol:Poly(glycerophosphate) glycerophosphotransferase
VTSPVWLVLADPLSTRVLVETGIVERLADELGDRLQPAFLLSRDAASPWEARLPGGTRPPLHFLDLYPQGVPFIEKVLRRTDRWLDRRLGYYPLAIRLNERHGFHRERMASGHRNELLDVSRGGPLPRHPAIERTMSRWHFSTHRYVSHELIRRLRSDRPAIVLSNLQMQSAVPFLIAGRRLALPLVGNVASWDHTVGKGVISPALDRYLVQNVRMRDDLVRYHGVAADRIVVTGWPQADVFHRRRTLSAYAAIVRGYGLDPDRPLVLVMGNTPTNTPHEARFFARLVEWWRASGASGRFSLLFRPHPRDSDWRTRFAAALEVTGAAVQEPSYTDLEVLATLLQHAGCVVTNAGTILLDALVNDRPVVCVLYDEDGGPPERSWAAKSVIGEHYLDVNTSNAFYRAASFEQVVVGIERSLAQPDELAEQRRRVVAQVVGVVDGRAAENVVEEIVRTVGR